MAWWRRNCDVVRHESLLYYNVGYEKCYTLFSIITMVIRDSFW